jgi:hypothetical protein
MAKFLLYILAVLYERNLRLVVNKALKNDQCLKDFVLELTEILFLKCNKTYILSILENCNLSFVLICQILIESLQKNVSTFICNKLAKYYLNYEHRFKYLKLNTLELWLKYLKFLFKNVINNFSLEFLNNLMICQKISEIV